MRKSLALVLFFIGSLCMVTASAADQPDRDHKITICHRTNSDTNPYVQITVDKHAADGVAAKNGPADHYGEHQGPIWNDTLKPQHIEWGDIIPPVEGFHSGLNWTGGGQAIYRNGCDVPSEVTTTTTVDETTTTTVEPTTTTVEPTTTTVPEETTTTEGTKVTPTTSPETEPTVGPPKRVTNVPPAVVAEQLPVTGSDYGWLTLLGVGLVLMGLMLAVSARRAVVR